MDISQLLEEKKQKLEQLRLQRIELEEVPNVEKQDTVEVSLQEIPQVKYDIPPPIIPKIEPVLPLQDADIEELESKLRKELEIKVRAELEDKYRKYYESAVQDLTKTQRPHSLQSEEGKEKLEHDVGFSFLAKWITPSAFLTCTFQNELSIWSDNKKSKIHIIEGSTVSAIEILDSKTLVVGDLEGNCKLFEM
ncbi:hypothetical protein BOH78_0430 [Pichia kudriavzevii]|uniref:Uncharacterized protein n=1 Tax=Pichia kudriavzevii TaxID=4909 RepID=A0A1V2LUU8_PICKU|nr:hypothetical protein BOH78_0430 [Pichia kudriavzevii]